jgi:GSH-dependent disulfide-bond oxidoreductase
VANTTIDLHLWPTPQDRKVAIVLEETGLQYRIFPVDINKDDRFKPEFLEISPNNKMPA